MQRDHAMSLSLIAQYDAACRQTDQIFEHIAAPFLTSRPLAERHRMLFYIGHLEAFDCNLLTAHLRSVRPQALSGNPDLDRLFAFGIDPVGGGLPTDEPADWPSLPEIYAYRDDIRRRVRHLTEALEAQHALTAVDSDELAYDLTLLHVMIEHRQMHAETLAYLLHQMPHEQKLPLPGRAAAEAAMSARVDQPAAVPVSVADAVAEAEAGGGMCPVPAGTVTLGLNQNQNGAASARQPFGWDNEHGALTVDVPAFTIDRLMVSNGDFLAFMAAGGYENPDYWSATDWAWRSASGCTHPAFWRKQGAEWRLRTMFDDIPLPLNWPVYVSHAEASAYARFAGKSLPTEAQWLRAAQGLAQNNGPLPQVPSGHFDFRGWDPVPVDDAVHADSAFGVRGQFGNGWEWTADIFGPLPGFEPFAFYPGYSADFFDGKHFVMKGGSARTAARLIRASFRNWFQPHYPYVYVGFRCVS